MPRKHEGFRIGYIVIGDGGHPYRFNGSCAYFHTYNFAHQAAELFWEKKDAQWVFNEEKKLYTRLAANGDKDGTWASHLENLHIMAVDVPERFVPSPHVRALRMAHDEMGRTGWFPAERRIKRVVREGLELSTVE